MRRGSVWSLKGMAIRGQEVFQKKNLVKICVGFSRSDFFSKMESTGCTQLMRKGIWTEKTSKDYQVFFETPPKNGPSSAGKDERQRTFRRPHWTAAVSIHKCRRPRESHPRFAGKEKKLYFRKIVAKTKILRNEKI